MTDIMGLRIVLGYGAFLNIIVPSAEAKTLLQGWKEGKLKEITGGSSVAFPALQAKAQEWCVRTSSISLMHTFDPMELAQQTRSTAPPWTSAVPFRS